MTTRILFQPAGSPAGTPPTPITLSESTDFSRVRALLDAGVFFWLDTDAPDNDDLRRLFVDGLDLHALVAEDILHERQTPKITVDPEWLYVVVHGVHCPDDRPENLETNELDVVLADGWVLTHHGRPMAPLDALFQDLQHDPHWIARGPAFLVHSVLDRVVDQYVPVMDVFDTDIEALEVAALDDPEPTVLQGIFRLKRSLRALRRITVEQREVLHRLARGEFKRIPPEALAFFSDVYDHFHRVTELTEGYREQLSSARDAYLAVVSNRMNEVMKALTVVATIMLPLTFIAGIYGMNFDHMPELHWRYGYAFAWGLMVLVALGMLAYFKQRRWL